ncbi:hypothetical protein ACFYUJ_38830 [Streptomyces sp. NPDC004520]|uniref:hypothetical protein n=1 Tax=Streptomyces sp. NPDC004520 TaxID=3364702 RepID=UPI00368ECC64
MSTRRDDVMAALRDWSKPGRRADLLADAWQAGETNVSALAEAARVSRPTVYADLRARGIDPDDRRTKGKSMILDIAPLDIEGFTGIADDLDAQFDAALLRWRKEHPDAVLEEGQTEGMRLVGLMDTTYRYANVRHLLVHEQVARAERDRLLHQVELRWEALSTASAWLAAHHAYILAVDEARIAVEMWRERAEAALRQPWYCSSPREEDAYEQIQQAGHPALESALADLDRAPAETAEHLLASLDQAHERRLELASQTLRVAQPAQ